MIKTKALKHILSEVNRLIHKHFFDACSQVFDKFSHLFTPCAAQNLGINHFYDRCRFRVFAILRLIQKSVQICKLFVAISAQMKHKHVTAHTCWCSLLKTSNIECKYFTTKINVSDSFVDIELCRQLSIFILHVALMTLTKIRENFSSFFLFAFGFSIFFFFCIVNNPTNIINFGGNMNNNSMWDFILDVLVIIRFVFPFVFM